MVGDVPDADLPLQHQQSGSNLPRHSQRQLVTSSDHRQSLTVHLFTVDRLQPTRSARRWHSTAVPLKPR